MIEKVTDKNREEYVNFIQNNPKGHFLQSPEWAKVKSDWKHEMIVVEENGEIKGTMSVLLRKVPVILPFSFAQTSLKRRKAFASKDLITLLQPIPAKTHGKDNARH